MVLGETMRQTGTLTKNQMYAFDEARRSEMKTLAEEARTRTGSISTIGLFGDAVQQKLVVGVLDAAAQTSNLRTTVAQQSDELGKAAKAQKDAMDPAAMQQLQQNIAETSNKMSLLLAEHLPKLASAFDMLMNVISKYVVPAFEFMMRNFELIVGVLVAFKGALVLASAAAKAFELYKNLRGPGTTPANPMWTREIGGGGGGGVDGDGPDRKKGKGPGIRNVVKGFGAVGAVVSAGMLVSDLSDINEQEKSGQLTPEQAKEAKGGAVGGAAGGAGGALAGAAAGAAVGSVVPIIGTVIGGAIGAALGGWLGSKGGELAGKKLTETVKASPKDGTADWLKINDKNINSWVDAVYNGTKKIEEVPGVYLPYVKERLAKKPVKTSTTSTTTTPQGSKAESSTLTFANSKDSMALVKEAYELANPKTPQSSNLDAARKSLETKSAENLKPETGTKASSTTSGNTTEQGSNNQGTGRTTNPPTTQDSAETLLAQLNSKMDQLIKINKDVHSVNERQLTAQQSMTGDLYVSV
jgi:hypothetical protein